MKKKLKETSYFNIWINIFYQKKNYLVQTNPESKLFVGKPQCRTSQDNTIPLACFYKGKH